MQSAPSASTLSDIGNSIPKVFHSTNALVLATTQYQFFQKLSAESTIDLTNMTFSAQFTEGTRFDQTGLGMSITAKRQATVVTATSAELNALFGFLDESYLQLTVNGIEWAAMSPTVFLGPVSMATTDVSTVLSSAISGGSGVANRWYPMSIPYDSKVAFIWNWTVGATTVANAGIAGYQLKLLLNGKYTYRK